MWVGTADEGQAGIVFDLQGVQTVESVAVWNYNKPAYTDYGVARATISAWTEGEGWKTVMREATFEQGEGSGDYDTPTIVRFEPVQAQKIRLEKMAAYYPKAGQVGLSEVVFYGPLGASACNPEPGDKTTAAVRDPLKLLWTAGSGAVVHDVYAGEDAASLTLLGRIKGASEVQLGGLLPGKRYCWRIDEVARDGSVAQGPVWSFTARGSQVGHWPLDGDAADLLGQRNGAVRGAPRWVSGHVGEALVLNGRSDSVEIPALNLNTDCATICAWIQADPQLNSDLSGIVFCRGGETVSGLHVAYDRLYYHWNDDSQTWNWDAGLSVPTDGTWVFAAMTVEPTQGKLYVYRDGELKSATNPVRHAVEEFNAPLQIGQDPQGNRFFKGRIDDVQIFDYALSEAQIRSLAEGSKRVFADLPALRLVDADLVESGQSPAVIAAEAEAKAAAEAAASKAPAAPKRRNLLPFVVIFVLVGGIAGVSALRKSK